MSQVLGLLQSKDPDSAAKVPDATFVFVSRHKDFSPVGPAGFHPSFCCVQVLELLLAMCSVSGLRSLLCEVVFRPAGPRLRVAGCRQGAGPGAGCRGEAGLALMQWLSSPVPGAESCSLQALRLLTELLEVRHLSSL